MRSTHNKYDLVLIGLSKPSDLSTNRLFTREFFYSAKGKLNPRGIIAFCLPGSLTYISRELKDLNGCILNALKEVYSYVRVIPGDYNIVLASDDSNINNADSALIYSRILQRNIKTDILVPAYLEYRLNRNWLDWFNRSMANATKKINRDLMPFAVFQMLIIWNKQFSPQLVYIFESLENLDLRHIAILIFILTVALLFIFRRGRSLIKSSAGYAIATTGFYGMLANLILIFSFQVFYGYLYHNLGILISIFMSGIALGSIYITRNLERAKDTLGILIKLEIFISIFSCILALVLGRLGGMQHVYLIFIALFFIAGLPIGMEFPLAGRIYTENKDNIGQTAGLLYFLDLLGGWLGGILGGVVLLPLFGIFATCMLLLFFKLSSLSLLYAAKKRLTKEPI